MHLAVRGWTIATGSDAVGSQMNVSAAFGLMSAVFDPSW